MRHPILILSGKGHGTFYRPDPVWVEPVVTWLRRTLSTSGGASVISTLLVV